MASRVVEQVTGHRPEAVARLIAWQRVPDTRSVGRVPRAL